MLVVLAVLLSGCTVTTHPAAPRKVAAYVGNHLNSGIDGILYTDPANHAGFIGFLVSPEWVAGYNTLAADYGYLMVPPVHANDGITPSPGGIDNIATAQAMVAWRDMKQMPALGRPKQSTLSKVINAL